MSQTTQYIPILCKTCIIPIMSGKKPTDMAGFFCDYADQFQIRPSWISVHKVDNETTNKITLNGK